MASDMFLKLDGVTGESTDDAHAQECEITSFSFTGTNASAISSATTGAGAAGRVTLGDFAVSKRVDDASTTIFNKMATGNHFASATITIRKPGGSALEYLIYKFGECFITAVSASAADGGGDVQEAITFAYTKMAMQYTSQADTGGTGSPTKTGWDLKANKEWAYPG